MSAMVGGEEEDLDDEKIADMCAEILGTNRFSAPDNAMQDTRASFFEFDNFSAVMYAAEQITAEASKVCEEQSHEDAQRTSLAEIPAAFTPEVNERLVLVLTELVETERRFVERLSTLVCTFERPLEQWVTELDDDDGNKLTSADVGVIFGNVDEVLAWAEAMLRTLQGEFEAAHAESADPYETASRIASVLSRAASSEGLGGGVPLMSDVFGKYARGHEASQRVLARVSASTRIFTRALELHPTTRGLPLRSYLMEPVQRIPRYGMLLAEAAKQVEPTSEAQQIVQDRLYEVAEEVKTACSSVDNEVAMSESVAAIAVGWNIPELAAPQRVLMHRGPLLKAIRRGYSKVQGLVFNDMFIYGDNNTHKASNWIKNKNVEQTLPSMLKKVQGEQSGLAMLEARDEAGREAPFRLRRVIPLDSAILIDKSMVYSASSKTPFTTTSVQGHKIISAMNVDFKKFSQIDANSFLIESPHKSGCVMRVENAEDKQLWIGAFLMAFAETNGTMHRRSQKQKKKEAS